MACALFNVIVDGQLLPGFDHDTVLAQLQQQLKLPDAKARQLLAGNTITVKRNVAAEVADAYSKRLRALGVSAHSLAIPSSAPVDPVAENYFHAPLPAANNRGVYLRALYKTTARCARAIAAYATLTLLAIGLTLYYLIHFAHLLTAPPILFSAIVFLLPLIVLLALSALLLRPFLPIQQAPADAVFIERSAHPRLFSFIDQLCAALAIKAPDTIAVSAQTHIGIALTPGFKSFWRGNYQLTLSLPLLDVCSIAEFGGKLAGTLRTGATPPGLRYTSLLQTGRSRLQGCINGADWLQDRSAHWQRFAALANATRFLVEQSNRLLQNYLTRIEIAHARFARALLAEHDRYLALLAGSAALPAVLLVETKLDNAAQDAIAKNIEDRIDSGLVDNLPALIRHYYDSLDEKFERETRRRWNNETTPRSDAPPIARDRIEQVAVQDGCLENSNPSSTLLENFPALATAATQQAYRAANYAFDPEHLLPVDALTYAATQDILQRQQATVYFNNWFKPFRFWSLANYQLIRDMPLQDAAQQLSVCVNEIRRLSPDRFKLLAEYERLQNQILEILLAQHVLAAGKPFSFRYVSYDGTTLQPLLEDRQQQLTATMEKLALQEAVMGGRITLGLRLCGQAEKDVADLHDTLRLIHDSSARVYKLALDIYQLEQLLQRHHQQREADNSPPIKRLEEKIRDASTVLLARLNDIPCPFDTRHRSLKSYVEAALQRPLSGADKSPVLPRAHRLLDTLYGVNEKLSLLAADYGTIAEEAYRIEPIKLVATTD